MGGNFSIRTIHHFILFLLAIGVQNLSGQLPAFSTDVIDQSSGLGHNHVECIFQDSDGFIWFGTRNGLCRYDGFSIKTFRTSSEPGTISGNRILSIEEDQNGQLWVGTFKNGLNVLDRHSGKFSQIDLPDLGIRINRIRALSDGSIWICTENGLGILRQEEDSIRTYFHYAEDEPALLSGQVFDVLETSSGAIFVANWSNTIHKYDPDSKDFTALEYERASDLNVDYRKRLAEDQQGNIWISATIHGVCKYDPTSGESKLFRQSNSGLTTDILNGEMWLDREGLLWISTDGKGIAILNPITEEFYTLDTRPSMHGQIPGNQVYAIYQDMQNHMWIGFFDKGVAHLDPLGKKFSRALFTPGDLEMLEGKSVLALFQDAERNIYAGTDGDGLLRYAPDGNLTWYLHDSLRSTTLSSDVITSIGQDPSGKILLGTYAAGFNILSPTTGSVQRIPEGDGAEEVSSSSVWDIFTDSRSNIWLGLLGEGVDLFNPVNQTFENLGPTSNALQKVDHPNVMTILEDSDGDIWFGTEGNGVRVLDRQSGKMSHPPIPDGEELLQKSIIRCLFEDKLGHIWIGTEGEGLFEFNKAGSKWTRYTTEDGLPDMFVLGVQEDLRGVIWIATGNGLVMYNRSLKQFIRFGISDGLAANIFNSDAILELDDGRILFGSVNGLDLLDPDKIRLNQNIPRVVLTSFSILNKEVEVSKKFNDRILLKKLITYTDHLTLSQKEKLFSLEFAALNYTNPENCSFEYRLEGFEEQWVLTDSRRRVATYSNLPPGDYLFRVRASNNDGKWGSNYAQLAITIEGPFWSSWWFLLLVAVSIAGIIVRIYLTRMRSLRNRYHRIQAEQEHRIMELEKENLESELKKLTFYRLNRNRNLLDIKLKLTGLAVKARDSVKGGLTDIIGEIESEIHSDVDWKILEPQLDKTYNNFLSKLRAQHEDLTLSEVKIAAYVRMNLSNKEIAEYMHKTVRAVENERYRLRKKLNLESNDSLREYLRSI